MAQTDLAEKVSYLRWLVTRLAFGSPEYMAQVSIVVNEFAKEAN